MAQVTGTSRRRVLGQVFTPEPVAAWMAKWIVGNKPASILDPALGNGVLVDAVRQAMRGSVRLDAFDIDPSMIRAFKRKRTSDGVQCRRGDFLNAKLPTAYDAVIANPPYVRHHELSLDAEVRARFDQLCRRRLSRMTNLYGFFLIRIWNALSKNGRAAVITPAEWLNADFGKALKAFLLEENAVEAIVHFDANSRIFDDALTTAAITLLRRGRSRRSGVRLINVATADDLRTIKPDRGRRIAISALDPSAKWTPLFTSRAKTNGHQPKLGDIATCTRGIATGANKYFTLSESERKSRRIDLRDLSLCITKAQQLESGKLTRARINRLVGDDEKIYLLNPRPRLTSGVERYLVEGRRLGIDRRYLPSHRPVWYRPEHRRPAAILVSVFARGAFKFVLNEAAVLNLTAFHAINLHKPSRARIRALFEYLNSKAAQAALADHQRIYGGGLLKLEPRDVEALPIPRDLALTIRN